MKFDEHFFIQILMALNKKKNLESVAKVYQDLGKHAKAMYRNLNFTLTDSQIKVLKEIRLDLC